MAPPAPAALPHCCTHTPAVLLTASACLIYCYAFTSATLLHLHSCHTAASVHLTYHCHPAALSTCHMYLPHSFTQMYVTYICTHVPDLLLHMCTCYNDSAHVPSTSGIFAYISMPVVSAASVYICHGCRICNSCCLGCGKGLCSHLTDLLCAIEPSHLLALIAVWGIPLPSGHMADLTPSLQFWRELPRSLAAVCTLRLLVWVAEPLTEHEKTKETELCRFPNSWHTHSIMHRLRHPARTHIGVGAHSLTPPEDKLEATI